MMIVYLFIGYIIGASITGWISIKLDERKKAKEDKENDNRENNEED